MTAQWIIELHQKNVRWSPETIGLRLFEVTTFGAFYSRRNHKTTIRKRKLRMWTTMIHIKYWCADMELFQGYQILDVKVVKAKVA
jgi:hypothetical protein